MNAGQLTVIEAGSTQLTDLGRRRGPSYGVPVNGALDQRAARIANILVGNAESAPLLEVAALDLEFVADVDILIAVSGAHAFVTVGGVARERNQPVSVRAGEPQEIAVMLLLIAQSAVISHGTVADLIDEAAWERELRAALDGHLRA